MAELPKVFALVCSAKFIYGEVDMKLIRILCFLTFLALFLVPSLSHADPLANWTLITSGTDDWFYGITYGNGKFVTVGAYGTVLTSTDGVGWTTQTTPITNHLYGVGFANNTYVAVGTLGKIITSPDGINWTVRSEGQAHPLTHNLYGVTYGNGKFVVVGGHGTILTSTDNGVTWDDPFWPYSSPTANWLYATTYDLGNTLFVDVGSSGTVLTSTDGTSWNVEVSGTANHLLGVTYGIGTFVAVGSDGTILTSPNGINWVSQTSGVSEWLRGVLYDNGYFVAVGDNGSILTSPDGVNWTLRHWDDSYDLEAVAYDFNNNAFAAVGGFGTILLDGDSVPTLPVRVTSGPSDYPTIQTGYDNASDGDTIQTMAITFNEQNINFNNLKSVTLEGGYDSTFTSNPTATTINGSLTISNGAVTVDKIIIQ